MPPALRLDHSPCFALLADISGSHKSQELDWQLFHRDRIGPITLLSTIALQYQAKQLVDYYYGESGLRFSTHYQADNQLVHKLEFIASYPVNKDFTVFLGTRNYRYQSSIEDSPVAEGRNIIQDFAGLGYRF